LNELSAWILIGRIATGMPESSKLTIGKMEEYAAMILVAGTASGG
jgi:hypothetical protein